MIMEKVSGFISKMDHLSIGIKLPIVLCLIMSFSVSLGFNLKYPDAILLSIWFWVSAISLFIGCFLFMPNKDKFRKS